MGRCGGSAHGLQPDLNHGCEEMAVRAACYLVDDAVTAEHKQGKPKRATDQEHREAKGAILSDSPLPLKKPEVVQKNTATNCLPNRCEIELICRQGIYKFWP